ncbi:hypothetical protein MAUB_55140 [Mycolicibacterium aubagnense]|uniref:Uncharacterized protein n=1 Tax=Mycolicibacterium aubagnense TaxID=319707 RepID=A0ABM7ILR9_9MYCO|nr:hypothetical protein [Mycolicibacterium aubagnense]WGI30995.1 hypothetical protein QDT91_17115 [Mycolicibacterium aubagnense]BBX87641.1 hypothetical protein MAUB_55140 [Mycolicibacterium aubagnense]
MTVGPENGAQGQPWRASADGAGPDQAPGSEPSFTPEPQLNPDLEFQPSPGPEAPHGSVRWQDPATAQPRQPSVAEARARDKAQRAREAAEKIEALKQEKARKRAATGKKVLIGSAVGVGVVAVVAAGYAIFHDDDQMSASCVKDGTNEVVPDSYCDSGRSSGGSTFFYAGSSYRYYYGGSNSGIGTIAHGGTLTLPKGTTATTKSGTSISKGGSSISRGGFGSSSHGSSGS